MDAATRKRLRQLDLLEAVPSGQAGVRVSLQYCARLTETSLRARRAALRRKFEEIASEIAADGATLDVSSLSVAGQNAEAVLPLSQFDELARRLQERDVRVDVLLDRAAAL
jgi:hypothetical protein